MSHTPVNDLEVGDWVELTGESWEPEGVADRVGPPRGLVVQITEVKRGTTFLNSWADFVYVDPEIGDDPWSVCDPNPNMPSDEARLDDFSGTRVESPA